MAGYDKDFSVNDAFKVLKSVSQKDLWATRVSFVYSTEKIKFIMSWTMILVMYLNFSFNTNEFINLQLW